MIFKNIKWKFGKKTRQNPVILGFHQTKLKMKYYLTFFSIHSITTVYFGYYLYFDEIPINK